MVAALVFNALIVGMATPNLSRRGVLSAGAAAAISSPAYAFNLQQYVKQLDAETTKRIAADFSTVVEMRPISGPQGIKTALVIIDAGNAGDFEYVWLKDAKSGKILAVGSSKAPPPFIVRATVERGSIVRGVAYSKEAGLLEGDPFEVRVGECLQGEDGHMRIGWCTDSGDVQAPTGYDVNSYSYRDLNGNKFHESIGTEYGAPYGPGDVIGCMLRMGSPGAILRERQRISIKGVEYIVEEERERTVSAGSAISYYKNGVPQGVAFADVWAEMYFPAVSLYKAACATFNFGPTFACPPTDVSDFLPMSSLASARADADADPAEDGDAEMEDEVDGAVGSES